MLNRILDSILVPGILFSLLVSGASHAGQGGCDSLTQKIQAIQQSIQNPDSSDALQSVLDLGLDSRYYVLVRGWLAQQLANDQSIADAAAPSLDIVQRIAFLKKAIRAIDLE